MSGLLIDLAILGGVCAIGIGLYLITPAAAWIYGGLVAATVGYAAHAKRRRQAEETRA